MQHGNSQMLPVLEISGWEGYRAGHRFDMVIGSRSGEKKKKDNTKAELQAKCFLLGSRHSLGSGIEKQQRPEDRRAIQVQSHMQADSSLGTERNQILMNGSA